MVERQNSMTNGRVVILYLLILRLINPDVASNRIIGWGILLGCCFLLMIGRASSKIRMTKFSTWAIAFMGICGLSILWALDANAAIDYYKNMVINFFVVYTIALNVKSISDIVCIIKAYFAAILTNALYLLVTVNWASIGYNRLGTEFTGEAWNANTIGMSMVLGMGFAFYAIPKNKKLWRIISLVVLSIPFIFSGSRKAWALLVVIVMVVFFAKNPKKIIRNTVLCIAAVALLFYLMMSVPLLYNIVGHRFEDLLKGFGTGVTALDSSAFKRQEYVRLGMEWFKDRPLIGYGVNCYRVLLSGSYMGEYTYSHNNYVELLVSVGVIGTAVFYYIYFYSIKNSVKYIFGKRNRISAELVRLLVLFAGIMLADLFMQTGNVCYTSFETYLKLFLFYSILELCKKEAQNSFSHKMNTSERECVL